MRLRVCGAMGGEVWRHDLATRVRTEVREAAGPQDVAKVRELMMAYGRHLVTNPLGPAEICLDGYEREMEALPEAYAAGGAGGDGVLLLAEMEGLAAGCVGLRPLPRAGTEHGMLATEALEAAGERACEMKRLWVPPEWRGKGVGRALVERSLAWAAEKGYRWIYLDTLPKQMPEAHGMYCAMGFEPVERYNESDLSGVAFLRRRV